MTTAFESDLEEFFYGQTCVAESPGYDRNDSAAVVNAWKKVKAIAKKAAGTKALFVVGAALIGGTNLSNVASEARKEAAPSASGIVRSAVVDERGRQELMAQIVEARAYLALSQQELADLLNISESTITKLEAGKHSPTAAKLDRYASFLGLANYLREKLHDRKYTIRALFHSELPNFSDKTPIEFAKELGDRGLLAVVARFKRQYG